MLTRFQADHFKVFSGVKLEDTRRINLIGGANNTGKSSLLEAIFFYFDRRSAEMFIRHMGWRGIRQYYTDLVTFFSPLFHNFDTGRPIRIAASDDAGDHELKATMKITQEDVISISPHADDQDLTSVPTRSGRKALPILNIEFRTNRRTTQSASLQIDSAGNLKLIPKKDGSSNSAVPPAVYIGTRANVSPAENAKRYGQLDLIGDTTFVLDALRTIDGSVKSLSTIAMQDANSTLIHADVGLSNKIPVNLLGDGTNRILSIILGMAYAQNGVALIDDVDSGLHYSILQKTWRSIITAAEHLNCQLFLTTHSWACVEALKSVLQEQLEPDFAYYRLERRGSLIKPVRYGFQELATAVEEELEVR